MKSKSIRILQAIGLSTLLGLTAQAHDKSAPLTDAQKSFLAQYEAVRAALATDDLAAAKTAATIVEKDLVAVAKEDTKAQPAADAAKKLSGADSLKTARQAFKALSKRAVHLAGSQKGYYIANCPMVEGGEGNWVQTTTKINNPYFGKAMLTCGSIKE
ncbi:MAG: DUF3347 domain-containing protein [Opitutaceae bacterium]|nr:DUF3347 domain-containing protein [Opitutaceae bacterium]